MKQNKESRFQFSNPSLENIIFSKNNSDGNEENVNLQILTQTSVYNHNDDECTAEVALNIKIGEQEKTPFFVYMSMQAKFKWESDIKKDDVNDLLKINAPALLYGYARPIVSSMILNSRMPAFDLPFINFADNELNDAENGK